MGQADPKRQPSGKQEGFLNKILYGTPDQRAEKMRRQEYNKRVIQFNAKYFGGHPGYPVVDNYWVRISLDDNVGVLKIGKTDAVYDSAVIEESIPYNNVVGLGNQKEEHRVMLGAAAPVGFGFAGVAGESRWAKRNLYTYLTYRIHNGAIYTLQFEFDNPQTNQAELFKRISH